MSESEDQVRQIIEIIPSLAWSARPDGSSEFFNQRWLDYTGLSTEQARNWGWTVAVHPDDSKRLLDYWRSVLASGEPGEIEGRLRRSDGVYRWFLFCASPALDREGKLVKWFGTNTDIEARKQAEDALRASEQNFRLIINSIPGLVSTLTPSGEIEFVNQQVLEYFGRTLDELRSWATSDAVYPDDLPNVIVTLRTSIETGQPTEVELRLRRADGIYRWFLLRRLPHRQADGRILRWYTIYIDIDDRRRAEDRLRAVMSERTRLSAVRAEIAMALASKDTLRGILHRCAETMVRHLDAAFARIWTLKSGAAELELEASAGMYTRLDGRFSRIPVGQLKIGLIARERKAHLTNDVQNDPRVSDHNWARAEKMQSFAGYPLVVEERVVGVMGMFSRQALTESTLETLAFIADGIAQGIDRKRAEDALKLLKDRLYRENIALRDEVDRASMFEEIVGTSNLLKAVLSRIAKVAPTDSTVLITGETGTGKELIARAIHKKSQRSGRAFVSGNCAAIPRDLIPSELFGHEKGAFTGATQRRLGRFELADGGTIFLDEVGELLPDTQVALLRVLQERELERVGGGAPIHVDVRVIAATNRDLEAAVADGTFRQDLFYRLNVFPIEVPPLRKRKDDILLLVEYFVQRYATKAGKDIRSLDKKTLDLLQSYDWPGNIRELQNVVERSVILSSGDVFSVDELWLSKELVPHALRVKASPVVKDQVEALSEREIIEAALAATRGRISGPSGAAAKLGIPPSTLETRIKALKIHKAQFKFR
jgi:PAS domain S-box-containing protein